jgi:HD superfamily phosphohydrolase
MPPPPAPEARSYRAKVLRDPVYGNISIPSRVLLELVDSPEFQRLRRIRQLGMCFAVFHGAEHSRFQHALGVMWLMHRILEHWHQRRLLELSEEERQTACAAALLHDVGHGPFSHALERVFSGVDHEVLGRRVIRRRLGPILERNGLDPARVEAILAGTDPNPVFHELLSSQLDVDRMDYLQRDSLYTGVKYGLFDIDRIVDTVLPMREGPDQPVLTAVDPKGTEAVEEYLFSRYFMHWQVYLHRTVRAAEVLLRVVLQRARAVHSEQPRAVHLPPNLRFLFEVHPDDEDRFLESFLDLDDFDVFHAIKLWRGSPDPVLADLATRFAGRRPFKALDHPGEGEVLERIRESVRECHGADWEWYLHEDTPSDRGYGVYEPGSARIPIRVLLHPPSGWREISQVTRTDAVLALARHVRRPLLLVSAESRGRLRPWLENRARQQP